jgi:hypothetical protein
MFKVGDRIKTINNVRSILNNYIWEVVELCPNEYISIDPKSTDHMSLVSVGKNVVKIYACQDDGWMYDTDYYRKLKLEKICSKLVIL